MWFILTSLVVSFVTLYHLWSKYKFDYWSKRGVKGPRAAFLTPFGHFNSAALKQKTVLQCLQDYYAQFPNEPVVGLYVSFKPLLMVNDPEYIQQILIKDFKTFENRGFKSPQQDLFLSEGDKWRTLRQHIRPLFSTGMLKAMVPDILECCEDFLKFIDTCRENASEHEMRSLVLRCTAAMTGSLLGIDFETFSDKNNKYIEVVEKISIPKDLLQTSIQYSLDTFLPAMDEINNTSRMILSRLVQRGKGQNTKEDIGDVLKRFQDQGRLIRNFENRVHTIEVNDDILVPIITAFILAFEPTASILALMFHELALNEEIQEKAYKEIKDITEKHNGVLSYEALFEMTYSQMIFKETTRKYSAVLFRIASEDFTLSNISGTKIPVEKGTSIVIVNSAIQRDPKHFENPLEFRPERFSPENEAKIPVCLFAPFGEGPRQCIGKRLATLQSLAVMATFLSRFKLEATEKTARDVKMDHPWYLSASIPAKASPGSWMKISKRI